MKKNSSFEYPKSNSLIYLIIFTTILTIIFFSSNCKNSQRPEPMAGNTKASSANDNEGLASTNPLKNMFGINMYEWNMLNGGTILEKNIPLIKSFSLARHYMDWDKLEHTQGSYTFNPTNQGGWDYDAMYTRLKQEGILVLACLKTTPPWLVSTWPAAEQDNENVPIPFGADRSDPASYIAQAKVAFQYAARYGFNTTVDKSLLSVSKENKLLVGMGLIKYIECNNEEDRWWKGPKAQQSAEEYAANMSAFYDGNMGKLGKGVGIKTADPTMVVVMGGLALDDPIYVKNMIEWCKKNRGYKADGSINLCFDIINYHRYTRLNDVGVAPELSTAGKVADSFVSVANTLINKPEVWITECGYDINPGSSQRAISIGNKSALVTQGDWTLRTALLYMRHGISKLFFYQLYDDTPNSNGTYATAGLVDDKGRRPAADYLLQTTKLMGNYTYVKTISVDPIVDVYKDGTKSMYVLLVPDQKGRTGTYTLDIPNNNSLKMYNLKIGADVMTSTVVTPINNKLVIPVSETPVFVGN